MDPAAKPPDQEKLPTSHAESSKGTDSMEPAESPESRMQPLSPAEVIKEKHRMTSSEPPAVAFVPVPAPAPVPVQPSAWPTLPISPDQGKSEIPDTVADNGPSKPDGDDAVKEAPKIVSPSTSVHSKQVMSYAAITRKNMPVPKQPPQQPHAVEKDKPKQPPQQPHAVEKDKPKQPPQQPHAEEKDKPKPVLPAPTLPVEETKHVDAPVTAQPAQRASSTPELLLAIENVVRPTEESLKSASPKPSDVPEPERPSWEKLPEKTSGMARQTAEPKKASPKKASPKQNRPLTWAGVVRGQKATVMPTASTAKAPTPQLQPGTPLLPSVTAHLSDHGSPTKGSKFGKENNKTPSQAKTKENSRHKTPGQHETGGWPYSPASTSYQMSQHQPQTPSQKPGDQKTKMKPGEKKGKGKGKAPASPSAMSNLSSSDVERNPQFAPWTDRRVPVYMYPSGNLAATLKKKQEEEELAKQQQAGPYLANPLPQRPAWPSRGHQASLPPQAPELLPAHHYGTTVVPVTFPPLNTLWPALPSQAGVDDNPYLNPYLNTPALPDNPYLNTPALPSQSRVDDNPYLTPALPGNPYLNTPALPSRSRVADNPYLNMPIRERNPTQRDPAGQAVQAVTNDEAARMERDRIAMRRGIPKTNENLWQFQFGWDVLVMCGTASWKLHRHVLTAQSPWFARRLPPHDPTRPYVEFNCDGHNVGALGHALWFMYHGFYPGCTLPSHDPLDGDCIRKNIYMYICGAGVDCHAMSNYAISAMDSITSTLSTLMPAIYKLPGLHRLYNPLSQGLELLHSQGNRPNMFPMRVAVARLVDVTLLYFMKDAGFKSTFKPEWDGEIYPMCFWDSVMFRRMGLIGEPEPESNEEAGFVDEEESDEGTVVGEAPAGEEEDDEDVTPKAERKWQEAQPRGEDDEDVTPKAEKKREEAEPSGEAQSQHGSEQNVRRDEEEEGSKMDTPSRMTAVEKQAASQQTGTAPEREAEAEPDVWCLSISKY